jgi:hypothetical protein
MKNYKRAKRRKDLAKKVKKRAKQNGGEFYYWMKYTSTPCSCDMCSYYKYRKERTKIKTQALKEALKEIEEENEKEI